MNHDQTRQSVKREQSFTKVGLLRSAQVKAVVLTAAQAQFEADNHHDHGHRDHRDHHDHHHHDHHRN